MLPLRLAALFLLALALAACSADPAPASRAGIAQAAGDALPVRTPVPTWTLPFQWTATPSATPPPTSTQRPVAEALFTATPTPVPCAETQGAVITASVPSDVLNYPIDAQIYLPPCYTRSSQRYPVLYLIHGLGFTNDQWVRLGAPTSADALIASGEVAPLIIVMPSDRRDERLDPALVKDLLPYVDANYRTLADREHRAIGGLSRGAGWSVHFGLRYPGLFGRVGAHSLAIFFGDERNLLQWTRHLPPGQMPAFYFDVGDGDRQIQSSIWFDQVLTWFKVEHTYLRQPGGHSEKYWSAHVGDYLRFYAADWRFAPASAPDPAEPFAP